MKKIKLIVASLFLTLFSYSQTQDTICHAIAGKIHFEFNYYESKIIDRDTSIFFEDINIEIKENEILVLDLYDDCRCVIDSNFIKERNIIIYYKNSNIETYNTYSKNETLYFNGKLIEKIIVKKPINL